MKFSIINIEKFKSSTFKVVTTFALAGTLTACATKDLEAPVVNNVSIEETTLTIEANDNKGVASYAITEKNEAPAVVSTEWQTSNTFLDVENGTYYIWVKDESNNVSRYNKEVFVQSMSEYEKNFDLINWLKAPVDQDLKQKYGVLYRMVEPLSKEEIEKRFEFLVWFSEEQAKNPYSGVYSENTGLYCPRECLDIVTPAWFNYAEKMETSKDPALQKYGEYFGYSKVVGNYTFYLPSSFYSKDGIFNLSQETKSKATFEDKEIFVRYIAWAADTELNAIKELGLEEKYYFEEPGFTYDNEFSLTK